MGVNWTHDIMTNSICPTKRQQGMRTLKLPLPAEIEEVLVFRVLKSTGSSPLSQWGVIRLRPNFLSIRKRTCCNFLVVTLDALGSKHPWVFCLKSRKWHKKRNNRPKIAQKVQQKQFSQEKSLLHFFITHWLGATCKFSAKSYGWVSRSEKNGSFLIVYFGLDRISLECQISRLLFFPKPQTPEKTL